MICFCFSPVHASHWISSGKLWSRASAEAPTQPQQEKVIREQAEGRWWHVKKLQHVNKYHFTHSKLRPRHVDLSYSRRNRKTSAVSLRSSWSQLGVGLRRDAPSLKRLFQSSQRKMICMLSRQHMRRIGSLQGSCGVAPRQRRRHSSRTKNTS